MLVDVFGSPNDLAPFSMMRTLIKLASHTLMFTQVATLTLPIASSFDVGTKHKQLVYQALNKVIMS